jgi:hypothetical protein
MRINLNKKKKPRNRNWFAWRPVIAEHYDGTRFIVWWEDVYRADSMGLVTYHLVLPKKSRILI